MRICCAQRRKFLFMRFDSLLSTSSLHNNSHHHQEPHKKKKSESLLFLLTFYNPNPYYEKLCYEKIIITYLHSLKMVSTLLDLGKSTVHHATRDAKKILK